MRGFWRLVMGSGMAGVESCVDAPACAGDKSGLQNSAGMMVRDKISAAQEQDAGKETSAAAGGPGQTPPRGFVPEPYAYHAELELRVETLTNLGAGVARDEGWVVMVPFALPGDRVRVRVFRNHKNYSEADLVEVIDPAPERVSPACPLFGTCGGCQYQHLEYGAQLEWKRRQVADVLARVGGLEGLTVERPVGSPRQYGYRSKLTPHYQKPRGGDFPIGFLRQGRRQSLVDVPQCPIATDGINEALPRERERVRELTRARRIRKGGTLLMRETLEGVVTDNNAVVSEKVGDITYQFTAGEFFQNNPFILPDLVGYAVGEALGGETGKARYLVDAYCGVGVFALAAARRFEAVMGVEVSAQAVRWANVNARLNGIGNASFLVGEAEAIFEDVSFAGAQTAMVVDPPRAGCSGSFLEQLDRFGPTRVVYVSCEPSTQARDLKRLLDGGYAVERVQPFDLFPQTRHIENVVTLSRGA